MEKQHKSGQQDLPAGIYLRISEDREGSGLGVERQETDCRKLADQLGWDVVEVYCDNDISAYSGKPRPQYERMLRAVRDGRVKGVLAWHPDRLHRRAMELEKFVTLAEAHSLRVQTVSAGTVDLSTPSGRMVARMLGAAAQHEVDQARVRMKRAKQQRADAGRFRGGRRPYGFEADGETVRTDEAEVVRDMTKAVLVGRSLRSLARELNEQGRQAVRLVKRKDEQGRVIKGEYDRLVTDWTYHALRDVLVRPRNAGKVSTGRPDRGQLRIVADATWPAIVDYETWLACYNLLMDPKRRTNTTTQPRWLGSNVYLCGRDRCGSILRVIPNVGRDGVRLYHYRCYEQNHLSILADKTDHFVRTVVVELVRDPRVVEAMTASDSDATKADRERRVVLALRLKQTERDYDEDLIDARRYHAKTARISDEIAQLDARLADAAEQRVSSSIFAEVDPGAAFLSAPIDVQRAVLRAVLRVEVRPAAKRGDKWKSDRLKLDPVVSTDT